MSAETPPAPPKHSRCPRSNARASQQSRAATPLGSHRPRRCAIRRRPNDTHARAWRRRSRRSLTAAAAIAQEQPPAGPDPAPLLRQALPARGSSVSALSRWTTTSDRAEPDELLHRAGGPPVDCADAHSKGRRCCRFDRRRSSGRGVRGACVGALTGSSSKRPTVAVRHRSNSQLQGSTRRLPVAATATHRSAGRLLRSQIDSDLGPATGTERDCFRTNATVIAGPARWLR